jgi:hypothetical protein
LLTIATFLARASFGAYEPAWMPARTSQAAPELPRILSARVVLGTKYGTAVRVSYCFSSLPSDPARRPWRLNLTLDNLQDGFPPLSIPWEVTERCATVIHPVGGIQQPYVLRYDVESARGTRSKQGLVRLKELPELARRPALPHIVKPRVVRGAEGRALRISYLLPLSSEWADCGRTAKLTVDRSVDSLLP